MSNIRLSKRYSGLAIGLGLVVLSGCSQINQYLGAEDAVDYKSSVAGDPLSIPPDLTQANRDARYRAPEGSATFSQYAQSQQQQAAAGGRDVVLPSVDDVEIRRDGDLRWLVVDRPAEQVYPEVVEFWGNEGFTIHIQDPQAGLIETDWAENRAKLPQGLIQGAFSFIFEQVADSGERERFRTRLERVNGKTEVYISHQKMVETGTIDNTGWKWIEGKEDPSLNAAMLARLMVFLGTDMEEARRKLQQAEEVSLTPVVDQAAPGTAQLTINESFDRAWRRVGVAIDSAGFYVDDRDRSAGEYYIRYLDTDTGEKIEQPGFFGRLFGSKGTAEAAQYRINVRGEGSGSVVRVLTADGQPDNSDTAKRIITVLAEEMR
ncbi:outer membrane protein assembly factor BamC [Neopusillimonas maritima]|uniref:Outer membrane protein assembly factor BamC n=1 Tax=Neopusillimonas maritima TaxID=2026239 RepID=A0A3A1YTV8_9BURK|nr:outer membrane protein assembly factor BamC [Neopusillimonas maritima]RIY40679.1 hypothetical protein CJP73_09455 [Neopusillimonas maritima]